MIYHANCLDVIASMGNDTIDALVTDPPYGLAFMNRAWDKALPDPKVWSECLRAMKPGAHGVIFGAPRMYHRLACQVEDAGFEVRDVLMWMFGSGFPKNHDPSKAVDKKRNDAEEVRVVCRAIRAQMDTLEVSSREIADDFGVSPGMVDHWAARDTYSQPNLPTWDQWVRLRDLLGMGGELDAEVRRLNDRKGQVGEAWLERPITGEVQGHTSVNYGLSTRDGAARDVAVSDEARRLLGLGTALKPAYEPILLVRKPLRGTVVENVLAYGTGCLNIGACRVGHDEEVKTTTRTAPRYSGIVYGGVVGGAQSSISGPAAEGRWPANVILDEEAGALLDEQSGYAKDGVAVNRNRRERATSPVAYAPKNARGADVGFGGGGGASRFFYCAKASKAEREAGLEHLDTRTVTDGREVTNDTAYQRGATERRNTHPTVKPIALMRYLVRLIAPEGGTVFDPFTGSGSTGVACALEDVAFVGAELEAEYVKIANARVEHALGLFRGDL